VNRLFAIPSRDDQFTASRGGTSVLQLLLNAARRHGAGHRNRNLCIAPTRNGCSHPTDGHGSGSLRGAEAIVAGSLLLVEWSSCGQGAGVRIVWSKLVTQSP